jgi:hypothetical protein
VRSDPWGYPLVYPAGAFIVTTGSDRRETGTHYTPKSLTEVIVVETLTPVVYVGPSEGKPRDEWKLKSPSEILELKVCDPAMGSGAFLVQTCRWLAERLVEAWFLAEQNGRVISVDGEVLKAASGKELLPSDIEVRTLIARRLIAERCLYGVDLNPLAVELAKLSIWLVTLAKGRPFGFLDHNLRCGDSLLGIHRLDQLIELSVAPTGKGQQRLFGQNIERAVNKAIELRTRLRELSIRDIRDVDAMACLDISARTELEVPDRISDAFVGEILSGNASGPAFESAVASLSIQAGLALDGDANALAILIARANSTLRSYAPGGKGARRIIHWPLAFPEVFSRRNPGFDGVVGNPPFMGGKKITSGLGENYRTAIVTLVADSVKGAADLCVYFFLRSNRLVNSRGFAGMLATDTIADGDSSEVGFKRLLDGGATIFYAIPSMPWPGAAGVSVAIACWTNTHWRGAKKLRGTVVDHIDWNLSSRQPELSEVFSLKERCIESFAGTNVHGEGFLVPGGCCQTNSEKSKEQGGNISLSEWRRCEFIDRSKGN